jgi:hypothetical protein
MRWERRSKRDVRGRVFRFYTCGHRNGRQRFVGSEMNGHKKSGLSRKRPFLPFTTRFTIFFFLIYFHHCKVSCKLSCRNNYIIYTNSFFICNRMHISYIVANFNNFLIHLLFLTI